MLAQTTMRLCGLVLGLVISLGWTLHAEEAEVASWRLTAERPVVISSVDNTPFKVTVIASESTPVQVRSAKPLTVIDGDKAPVKATEERSVRASGKGNKPITLQSDGDNVISIANNSASGEMATIMVSGLTKASPFKVALNTTLLQTGAEAMAIQVAKTEAALEGLRGGVKPATGLSAHATLGMFLLSLAGFVATVMAIGIWKLYATNQLSDKVYACQEALRRAGFQTYAKVSLTAPKRNL